MSDTEAEILPDNSAKDQDWTIYYLDSERYIDAHFEIIEDALGDWADPTETDFTTTLDFACGWGRMGLKFAELAKTMIFSDIREDALRMCRKRFRIYKNSPVHTSALARCEYEFVRNTETSIPIADSRVSFMYSWDSLVHLELSELRPLFHEFARVLRPGGRGVVHHSNLAAVQSAQAPWHSNHGSRSWVSAADVKALCESNGMRVERQLLHSRSIRDLDCITLFEKD